MPATDRVARACLTDQQHGAAMARARLVELMSAIPTHHRRAEEPAHPPSVEPPDASHDGHNAEAATPVRRC